MRPVVCVSALAESEERNRMKPQHTLRSQCIPRNLAVGGLLAVLLWLPPAHTLARTAVQAWVQRYNRTGFGFDVANAVAVDASNNVIVTGYSYGLGTFVDSPTITHSPPDPLPSTTPTTPPA